MKQSKKEQIVQLSQTVPEPMLPLSLWPHFFYDKQTDFILSDAFQRWLIAGNGTGKSLVVMWNMAAYMVGGHPHQLTGAFPPPPHKIRMLVPDFDKVTDICLDKLLSPQLIVYQENGVRRALEVGPLFHDSMIVPKRNFTKDHRGIELKNGSAVWFVTNEQGWRAMRGGEYDILVVDEEPGEREFDECLRGLRNAKGGGKVLAGLTPPYEMGCGPTWTREGILDRAKNNGGDSEDIEVFNACMADNPAIDKVFIKRFSEGKTKEQLAVQLYGQYPAWGDLVHPDFENEKWDSETIKGNILPNDAPMPENYAVDWVMAFDWHPSKPCAAIFGWVDSDGNLIIYDELDPDVSKGKDIDDLSDLFRSIEGEPHSKRRFRRWQDPSAKATYQAVQRGFNAWDAFRKAGIVTSAGKNRDPHIGISIVNEYFRGNAKDHPRTFIYERCRNLRRALLNHYWKRGEDGKGKPDPRWSDFPVTLKYIIQEIGWKEKNKHKRRSWPLVSYKKPQSDKHVIDLGRFV